MADTKLSALTELAAAPATTDEVYIRDVSEAVASESKRITMANLLASLPATTLGGTVTLNGQVFDAGSGNLLITTTGNAGLHITSTSSGNGIFFALINNSASPAVGDWLFRMMVQGNNDAATPELQTLADLIFKNVSVSDGAEDAELVVRLANAGALYNEAMTLSGAGLAWFDVGVDVDEYYKVAGTQVVAAQGAAVADAAEDLGEVTTQLNLLLARCRAHGLIAT